MVAELGRFLRGEILFLVRMQVFFHLLHDMLGLMKVLNIQVRRGTGNLQGMAALRAELPLLETVHVRKCAAGGAPDNEVHTNVVMRVIVIKIYRHNGWKSWNHDVPAYPVIYGPWSAACRCETKSLYQTVVS